MAERLPEALARLVLREISDGRLHKESKASSDACSKKDFYERLQEGNDQVQEAGHMLSLWKGATQGRKH